MYISEDFSLKDIKIFKIYHFGNEQQKRRFIFECIIPFARENIYSNYFILREWNGGPNVQIVFANRNIDIYYLEKYLQKRVYEYNLEKFGEFSQDVIKENIQKYLRNAKIISQMERKTEEKIDLNNHLKVKVLDLDMDYYKRLYNSSAHLLLHIRSKFKLQPILEEILKRFKNKENDKILFVLKNYHILLKLFEHGEKYASIVYYSHIAGMFAIAEQYGVREKFEEYYDSFYKALQVERLESLYADDPLLLECFNVWKDIYDETVVLFEQNRFAEEGYLSLEEQINMLKKNVSEINSEFHDVFVSNESVDDLVSSKEHMVLRSLVNILYSILPTINISFIYKHFCCYAMSRYIFEKYNTDWKTIFCERGII
ncbi:hypothetical protein SAMN02745135_01282 [Caloranaerobacter azorensis DSM 13643]|uniref:Thiopeptide-type bacteriocin biosynthesis domain-containing protein n=1 Tax=Caloranaerobacter azorensis DSM 13643 TaxID=1121264 RepID=A0A1M5U677_9FIRM|nr:hypothetical protein [Caloranaerobacter azorensis]SHH58532.1 hypothetical protein SAMN02745135_01282 [Caloranaerobacter azorensis DSM 13643]